MAEIIERATSTPSEYQEAVEAIQAFLAAIADAIRPAFETIVETLRAFIEAAWEIAKQIINLYPNKRVIYLATHGKRRTRKKNINRILKYFEREARR